MTLEENHYIKSKINSLKQTVETLLHSEFFLDKNENFLFILDTLNNLILLYLNEIGEPLNISRKSIYNQISKCDYLMKVLESEN